MPNQQPYHTREITAEYPVSMVDMIRRKVGLTETLKIVCGCPFIFVTHNVEITRAATDKRETTAPIFGVGLIDGLCEEVL